MPPIREFEIFCGDCRDILPTLPRLADACICDPPYGLKFMGKGWDHGVPGPDFWKAILDACKPGAHLLAFGGSRTFASAPVKGTEPSDQHKSCYSERERVPGTFFGDSGSAARFFYCAKASKQDRDEGCESMPAVKSGMSNGAQLHGEGYDKGQDIGLNRVIQRRNHHPTVKPTALMRYLVKLVSRPGHTILDPFSGSGSTGKAAILEARQFLGIELQPEYVQIATARLSHAVKLHQESSAQQNLL